MYNKELNDRCIELFKHGIRDKRVVIVGNAISLLSSDKHGERIDDFDIVVRLGKGVPMPELAQYVGTKKDVWFFGPGRATHWTPFADCRWKIFTPSQVRVYEGHDTLVCNTDMYTGKIQVYRDFFMTGTTTDILALNKKVNKTQRGLSRVSQGLQAVEFFNKIGVPVTLIGFDFFEGSFTYNFENSKHPHIPMVQPTSSWHCPLISKEYEFNPHGFSLDGKITNEENYIRSLQGVRIIKMPPLDIEKCTWLADKLRGIKEPS